jgi:hypothetical protein
MTAQPPSITTPPLIPPDPLLQKEEPLTSLEERTQQVAEAQKRLKSMQNEIETRFEGELSKLKIEYKQCMNQTKNQLKAILTYRNDQLAKEETRYETGEYLFANEDDDLLDEFEDPYTTYMDIIKNRGKHLATIEMNVRSDNQRLLERRAALLRSQKATALKLLEKQCELDIKNIVSANDPQASDALSSDELNHRARMKTLTDGFIAIKSQWNPG